MSPSGALHYVKDIEEIAMDLTDMMLERRCEDGSTEVGSLCQQYALESIASIFYGERFRVMNGEQVSIWSFLCHFYKAFVVALPGILNEGLQNMGQ